MDTFLIKAVQLILAFAILVIIHEFGHFFFARIFGIRVEKFYIFFDPWTEIFKWKPKKYFGFFGKTNKLKTSGHDISDVEAGDTTATTTANSESEKNRKKSFWGDTEYGIGWLPLGGYCKISGMIDESMDTEQMRQPAKDWEFRSKPAWQRLLVMIAGVLFNFLLALLIYAGIVYATGEKYVPFEKATMGMQFSGEAIKAGFHNGDIPLYADGEKLDNPYEDRMKILQAGEVTVLRGRDTVNISIPEKFIFKLENELKSDTATINFMTYRFPTRVSQVMAGEGAAKAGIEKGDEIIAVNGKPTPTLIDFLTSLPGHENQKIDVSLLRKNTEKRDTLNLQVALNDGAKMGIGLDTDPSSFFESKEIRYNLLQSVPRGIQLGTDRLVSYAKSMKMVFTKEGANSIGGFGSIGSIFPEKWDWIAFWNIAAFLSVALAFMNILPIPALDGGHVMFLLYEVIFRRKPSEKFMERAQLIGMILLISLLIYANGMDIVRLFK
ncbi:MAG: RIP metalloprotease RseP [Muribaculaceae bacterium]|nr:RIP metalloprotease RseP [Muribaculaceae bacterium]